MINLKVQSDKAYTCEITHCNEISEDNDAKKNKFGQIIDKSENV